MNRAALAGLEQVPGTASPGPLGWAGSLETVWLVCFIHVRTSLSKTYWRALESTLVYDHPTYVVYYALEARD